MPDLKIDFADWTWAEVVIGDCPQSEMDQLAEEIRLMWNDPEQRAYWEKRITEEGQKARDLRAMSVGITDRIRQSIKEGAQ